MSARYGHLRYLGFSAMLTALLMGILFLGFTHRPLLADPDIGWHLRNAQLMLQQHSFIRHDSLTFSLHGHAWMDPEWLSELGYYAAFKGFNIRGIEVLLILLLLTLTLAVFFLALQRTGNPRPALLAAWIFTFFCSVSYGPRTQLFGWIACAAVLAIVHAFRSGRDLLWLLPPLFALWINLHGSWPFGFVLLALFLATGLKSFRTGALEATAWSAPQRNRLLLIAGLSAAAVFLNPYGWRLVAYPFLIGGKHKLTVATVQEWQSLDFHDLRSPLIFALLATFILLKIIRSRPWVLYDVCALLFAVLTALTYRRFLLFAGLVFCPMLAEELTFLGRDKPEHDKPLLNAVIIAAVLLFAATHIPTQQELTHQSDTGAPGYPADAVAWLRQHPASGPVFNDFNWGGYLIWNLPTQPVFIDTRTDVFDETGLYQTYFDLLSLKTPLESYNNGELRYALLPPSQPLASVLSRQSNWTIEYRDPTTILFHRIN